jgi:putative transposase
MEYGYMGMKELDEFLAECRECKRALAVKLDLLNYSSAFIEELLGVSGSFIRKWRNQYDRYGIDRLYLQYHGSQGYLSQEEREEVLTFLRTKDYYSVEALRDYLEEQYAVVYKSKQSYYDLLHEAKISWKKTEKSNPKKDEKKVAARQQALKKNHPRPSRRNRVRQTGRVTGR